MKWNSNTRIACLALIALFGVTASSAQQKVGYVDSEYILTKTPEYVTVQQQLDRTADEWNSELTKMGQELDQKFRDYQARELLYTNEERQRRRQDIVSAEEDLENRRAGYFGPEGEIFTQQEQLIFGRSHGKADHPLR